MEYWLFRTVCDPDRYCLEHFAPYDHHFQTRRTRVLDMSPVHVCITSVPDYWVGSHWCSSANATLLYHATIVLQSVVFATKRLFSLCLVSVRVSVLWERVMSSLKTTYYTRGPPAKQEIFQMTEGDLEHSSPNLGTG